MKNFILTLFFSIYSCVLLQAQINVIAWHSQWKYYAQGNVNNNQWNTLSFNDNTWQTGQGELGYGDGDEATVVNYGGDPNNKYITTYFRKTISLSQAINLDCQLKLDDGAVVYVNGTELYRVDMPTGSIAYNSLASVSNENKIVSFTIPQSMLNAGNNVIAVEIHQNTVNSSDISFDMQVVAQIPPPPPGLYINEFMASNNNTIADNTGDYADWVELLNTTSANIDLANYYMTDDTTQKTKFRFTSTAGQVVVPANGYLLLWASGEVTRGNKHLNFSLANTGEQIALIEPDGMTTVDKIVFPQQRSDIAYGRFFDADTSLRYLSPATPALTNNTSNSYIGILNPPTFSHQAGIYGQAFNLTLSSAETNATIYYTLDGSEPDFTNLSGSTYTYKNVYEQVPGQGSGSLLNNNYITYQYNNAISITDKSLLPNFLASHSSTYEYNPSHIPSQPIFKGNMVRAKVYKNGYLSSEAQSNTYLVTSNPINRFHLPIVSVAMPPKSMYDYQLGVYNAGITFDQWRASDNTTSAWGPGFPGNFNRSGDEWEVKGNVEFFDNTNSYVVINQPIGIRIHGGYTRALPQKTLRLYSNTTFSWPFFTDQANNNHKRLLLRNSGNDWGNTMFKDAMYQGAVRHLNFDTQAYKATIVLLNGEYWGVHNLRERIDKYYFLNKYNVPTDSIDLLENSSVEEGDFQHYNETINLLQSGVQGSYYDQINTRIDIDNFIDYQIAEIYISNTDWIENNVRRWRKRVNYSPSALPGHDGKWRWVLYDTDWGMSNGAQHNGLAFATNADPNQYPNPAWTFILRRLLENITFKNKFITRFADLLNSAYLPNRMNQHILTYKNKIETDFPEHISRWKAPTSMSQWNSNIQVLLDFVNARPPYQRQHILSQFGIGGEFNLTVSVSDTSAGFVKVNTIDIKSSTPGIPTNASPWTGTYFDNIPFNITAKPKSGYIFKHWVDINNNIISNNTVININTSSNVYYKAVFEQQCYSSNPLVGAFVINPCGYKLSAWAANKPALTYPDSMRFVYMSANDPTLADTIAGVTTGVYNLTSRTRINGLGNLGFSFINTGNGNTGYPAQQLGGALLALNTADVDTIYVVWKGRTITPNSKQYRIRLQARVGDRCPLFDILGTNNEPIEYIRSNTAGDSATFIIKLPSSLAKKEYIQLFWRYYYTGVQSDPNSGARDQLAIDDIEIFTKKVIQQPLAGTQQTQASIIEATNMIQTSANVTYTASKSICLLPGFESKSSSVFLAKIGCQ